MKLSEAIREGAKTTLHNQTNTFFEVIDGKQYACALGAAVIGYQTKHPEAYLIQMFDTVPLLKELSGEIIRRNRTETRERIADWVEQIEKGHLA